MSNRNHKTFADIPVSPSGTCRLCGDWHEDTAKGALIRYGVRHNAHADCALKKWGAQFFDRLHAWQIENFPALIAARHGLFDELGAQIRAIENAHKARVAALKKGRP
jgi:hypothetical protein